jgi:uncharacterized protein YcnI
MLKVILALAGATVAALAVATTASAHAHVTPPVALAKEGQVFTLAVPTEEANATTTKIEFTPPTGFSIDSFVPSPGWKRAVQQTGSGDNAVIQKVTWSGGSVRTGEDSMFQFIASTDAAKTYRFAVRQTYSNGKIVDWSGPESSDMPAPTVKALSSLGGGSSSTWGIAALIVAIVALLVALAGLASGRRAIA